MKMPVYNSLQHCTLKPATHQVSFSQPVSTLNDKIGKQNHQRLQILWNIRV
jgi:hypothetical protein